VSIAAAEDLHYLRRAWPDLTGVTCDRYRMGAAAAEMMLAKLDHSGQPQPSQVFKGQVIAGETVGPASTGPAAHATPRNRKPMRPAKR
jgi:DNA-binding LacI/PurR family transcriptional regulator